jgi:hypothetical protein
MKICLILVLLTISILTVKSNLIYCADDEMCPRDTSDICISGICYTPGPKFCGDDEGCAPKGKCVSGICYSPHLVDSIKAKETSLTEGHIIYCADDEMCPRDTLDKCISGICYTPNNPIIFCVNNESCSAKGKCVSGICYSPHLIDSIKAKETFLTETERLIYK